MTPEWDVITKARALLHKVLLQNTASMPAFFSKYRLKVIPETLFYQFQQ